MKIIAGIYKGRKLKMPVGNQIRPTPGKVKEAVFSIIGHDLSDALVVDLFAGTGSLGLEALSRGAKYVWLGDKSIEACQLISENIKTLGAEDKARLVRGEWQQLIAQLKRVADRVDVIFLDPPFEGNILESAIKAISGEGLLKEDGTIVAEHDYRLDMPETIGDFVLFKRKKYGNTIISLYGFELSAEESGDGEETGDSDQAEETGEYGDDL